MSAFKCHENLLNLFEIIEGCLTGQEWEEDLKPVVPFYLGIEDFSKVIIINNLKIFITQSFSTVNLLSVTNHVPPVEGALSTLEWL